MMKFLKKPEKKVTKQKSTAKILTAEGWKRRLKKKKK